MVGILTFMSRINFVLSWVEHEKSFITSMPGSTLFFYEASNILVDDKKNIHFVIMRFKGK